MTNALDLIRLHLSQAVTNGKGNRIAIVLENGIIGWLNELGIVIHHLFEIWFTTIKPSRNKLIAATRVG